MRSGTNRCKPRTRAERPSGGTITLSCGFANIVAATLSPRTVNKHLEVIFHKLGVENLASAAVLASRSLGAG